MNWLSYFTRYGSLLFLCGAGLLSVLMVLGLIEHAPQGAFGWSSMFYYITFPFWHILGILGYRAAALVAGIFHGIAGIFMSAVSWSCIPDEPFKALAFVLWASFHFLFILVFLKIAANKQSKPANPTSGSVSL